MNGAISNLGDTWSAFMDNILNDARENMIAKWVQTAGEALHWLDVQMNGAIKSADKLAEVDSRLSANRASLAAHSKNGAVGSLVDDLAGYDPAVVKNQIESDIKLREKLTGVIASEKVEQDKLIQSMSAQTAATGTSTSNKKEQEKAAKAAERAENALAKSYDDAVTSLSLHNIELSKTPRELEEATLASKGYTKAMIAQAMALYDAGVALEQKKKLNQDEKSEMDSLIDRYNKATLSARDYYATTLTTTGTDGQKIPIPAQDKAPILAQFDKTTGAEAAKKAQEDAKTTLDAYNKSLDDAKTKTQDLGAITTAIFDGALGGISLMTGALTTMTDSLAENSKAMAELNKNQLLNNSIADPKEKAANFKKYAKEEADLNAKNVQIQMTGTRQVAMAASKMFSEKSAGAKAFHALSVSIDIAQQAMRIKDMAMSAVATAKNIAEGASKLFAQSGWLGFAGVAAMLALMAGLGAMASGGGGGSSTQPTSDTGTGTVLGDPSAVSESINKTNDLLKTIHASEYVELRGINKGVNNLQNGISKTVDNLFQTGGMANFQTAKSRQLESVTMTLLTGGLAGLALNKIPVIGSIMSGISRFFFGGKVTQSIVGQGIGTNATSLQNVIDGGNVSGYQYADIKTHTSGGLFTKSKTKYSTQYQGLSSDMQKSLNDIFSSVGDTIVSIAGTLGKSIETDLMPRVMSAVIPAMRVNLMGLSGDDAAKKLNGVISAMMDNLTTSIFGDIVGKYQKLGESMLETTVRIVSEVTLVQDALKQSGLKLLKDDVIGVSDAIVQTAGGLEEFQKQFEDFYDKFYTDAEKQARLAERLHGTFAELFPESTIQYMGEARANYRKVIEALDMSTQAGQAQYSMLIELAGAADTYYSGLESEAKAAAAAASAKAALEIKLMEAQGNTAGALARNREIELAAMSESLRPLQILIYSEQDLAKSRALEIKLMEAQGNTAGALARNREIELAAMSESLRPLQILIYSEQDLAKSRALEIKLMGAQGRTAEALAISRQKELDAMEPSLRATQEAINKQEDFNKTQNLSWQLMELQGKSQQVVNEKRALELAALSEEDAKINRLIYAEQDLAKVRADALTSANKAMSVLQKSVTEEKTALTKKYNADIESTQLVINNLTSSVAKLTSLSNALKNSLRGMSAAGSESTNRINAQSFIASALKMARSGKAESIDETQLNDALSVIAKPSELLFATFEDYQRDFLKTAIDISNLSDETASQTSKAVSQLDVAKSQLEAIKTANEAENLRLDAILTSAQDQLDAINGTTIAVMSVAEAITNLSANLSVLNARQNPVESMYQNFLGRASDQSGKDFWNNSIANGSTINDTAAGFVKSKEFTANAMATGDPVASLYSTLLGRKPDEAGYNFWNTSLNNGQSIADIATAMMDSPEYAKIKAVRGYASGGYHEGGWRMVGENGPELEKTGASKIFSNQQSKSLVDNSELVAEVKALREEIRAGQAVIANNTKATTKILRDVTQNGTSISTVAA
jgi:hypothetical protein